MKNLPKYLVAKYVSDQRRMEPRNIGVVLWASGRVAARFLDSEQAEFVGDKKTYSRWVDYWQELLHEGSIPVAAGASVPLESPAFLDEFRKTQKGNYLLYEGGYVTDKVKPREMGAAAEYLFSQLVARRATQPLSRHEQVARLKVACDKIMAAAGVTNRNDFKTPYEVPCAVGHVTRPFSFNYAIGNGAPAVVYQRVRHNAPLSVNSASFMFDRVVQSRILSKTRCIALVQADNALEEGSEAGESLEMLAEFATVVNVADYDTAVEQVAQVTQASASGGYQ